MTNKHKRKVKLQILKPRNPLVVEVMRKSVRKHKNRKREVKHNPEE